MPRQPTPLPHDKELIGAMDATPQPAQYSTLRISLILPFIALVALLTGTVGVMWYWSGTRTISSLSQHLINEMVERIAQAVQLHVNGSAVMLAAAWPPGLPAGPDIRTDIANLRQRLWTATALTADLGNYVHYGNRAGQNIGLKRTGVAQAEMRLKTHASDPRIYYRIDGIAGESQPLSSESTVFDPRTRPWFEAARASASDIWTPVYIDFNARDLVMTRSRRVLAADGSFEGVVATDLFLAALQDFVAGLPMTSGGQAMLLEPDGAIIAISGMPNMRVGAGGKPERIWADRSGNPLLANTFNALRQTFAGDTTQRREPLVIATDGGSVQVAFKHITDDAGLNWLAVVALPHKAMLAGIRRDVVLVVALGLLVLGTTLLIGLRIFGGVARDMRTLTYAVRRVGQGEIDAPIAVTRNDEIGELAQNFHHMRHSLFTDPLTGVSNRSALNHILATLTRASAADAEPPPFALLFIDLNRFKPLNDRWGHDNGDLALIEVAQRMRRQLRTGDIVARLGGDEFVAVVPGIASDAQVQVLHGQLLAAITQPLTSLQGIHADKPISVGAAIGYALFPRDGADAGTLLKHADEDMYRKKAPNAER